MPDGLARTFVERDHGIGADLRELAVSLPGERNYVDVSYSGYVREPQRPADGKRDVLIGKGALNCDGTVRVWSMAVKASKAEAFTACSGRNGQRIGGLVVCRMR